MNETGSACEILDQCMFLEKLPTYPSPNQTLTLTFHLKQNNRFWGGVGGQFPGTIH